MKKCNKCLENRSLDLYVKDIRNKDGLQGICNVCRTATKKAARDKRRLTGPTLIIESKTCNTCEETKLVDEFYRDSGISDGYRTDCKMCRDLSTYKWRNANRDQYNENQRKQHSKNYDRNRLYRYDLTIEQYNQILLGQRNLCAICLQPPKQDKPLVIDHCHKNNIVRGLLCYKCNRDMAVVDDNEHLKKCLLYRDKK